MFTLNNFVLNPIKCHYLHGDNWPREQLLNWNDWNWSGILVLIAKCSYFGQFSNKMTQYYGIVSAEIYFLMFCGVWPVWKKPLAKYKILNSLIIIYSAVIMACFLYNMMSVVLWYQQVFRDIGTAYLISIIVLITCDTVIKVNIIYISFRGYDNLFKKVQDLPMYNGKNRKIQGYLLIVMILLEVCVGNYAYDLIYDYVRDLQLQLELNKLHTLSKTEAETFIYLTVNTLLSTLEMIYIPNVVILGLAITVWDAFRKLSVDLLKYLDSNEIYNSEFNYLSEIRQRYLQLCDIVTCIDKTFRINMVFGCIFLGSSLLNNIYYFSAGCFEVRSYIVNLLYNLGSFLILCIAGALFNDVVSKNFVEEHKGNISSR